MGERQTIRAYDYVNQPYEPVRDAIRAGALSIFQRATKVAEERSESVVSALSVDLAGIEISKDIEITVRGIEEEKASAGDLSRITRVELEWKAAAAPGLFPAMTGTLKIYPLSHTETQVELIGKYTTPLGMLGEAIDAVVGHRLAEASVHRFVRAVVERLRADLA